MTTTEHFRKRESSPLAKLPGVAVLLLFLLAFVGQALHSHLPPPVLAHAASHAISGESDRSAAPVADTAETCSLCVAMQSAAPSSAGPAVGVLPVCRSTVLEHEVIVESEPVAFARLSRPPPTLSRAV
ncbi:hypothetical protein [Terriglobus aquaticus]|uniref:DUF2946 domain-containing protein n=1 Tax=Terriglobus aquaticus TaxID=940139 RepID=A0ABW9KH58_9BACT|nr:hypothetical protein [Terriglobus aquaticus]